MINLQSVIGNIGAFTNEAILVADVDPDDGAVLTIRWINAAFTDTLGYTDEDALGQTAALLAGPETDVNKHTEIIDKLMDWQHFSEEVVVHTKDGRAFWAQLSFQPLPDETHNFRFWICTIRDIAARKAAEDQLRDLALIAETTQDMVIVMDARRHITWVNPSMEAFTGYTLKDVKGRRISDVLEAPTADQKVVKHFTTLLDNGQPAFGQILSHRKDGSLYLGEYEIQPIFDDDGHVIKFVSLHRDVTERTSLERRYGAIINQTGMITYVKQAGRYTMVNTQLEMLFGQSQDWFRGKDDADILGEENGSLMGLDEDKVYQTGITQEGEREVTFPDGSIHTFIARAFRIFEPTLNDYLVCCVASDVTALKKTEQELRETRAEAQSAERRMFAAIDAVPDGFALNDAEDRLVVYNKAFTELHGFDTDVAKLGMTAKDSMLAAVRKGIWDTEGQASEEWIKGRLENRAKPGTKEEMRRTRDGRWFLQKIVPVANGETATLWFDMTEIKLNEEALKAATHEAETAQARLMAAIDALEDAFVIFDSDDRVAIFNERHHTDEYGNLEFQLGEKFEDILRGAVEKGVLPEAIGREEEWLSERVERHRNPGGTFEQRFADGRCFRVVERRTRHGDLVRLRLDITRDREQQQQLSLYAEELKKSMLESEQRNSELEEAKARIEFASLHDALTGLANRRYLDQVLPGRIDDCIRNGTKFAALHIDLDYFKQINDTLGHDAGDHVLKHIADILRESTDESGFAARVGGDEFVILSECDGNAADLARFAAGIIGKMKTPLLYHDQEIRFGASIGIAVAAPELVDPKQVLINADMALYKAKEAGRNKWAFFSDVLQSEMIETKKLADDIIRAIDNSEFVAFYQPQFDAKTLDIVGVEALVRWRHPDRGLLTPDKFLKVASNMNLIRAIDQAMLQCVVRDRDMWVRAGVEVPKISINISGRRLRDPELIDEIRAANFKPGTLSIELLESIFLDEEDDVMAWNIDQLRDMGVTIELDDFGTGHSSIVGLIKLKPARLKIDRQFIAPIIEAEEKVALVRAIIEIGQSLNVEVVAEGVETQRHGEILAELGCDLLQGYAYAQPMSADRLIGFIDAESWYAVV